MRVAATLLKWILAILFVAAGTLHFVVPYSFARIVPPVFPAPLFLVYLSGALEIVFGVLLLAPRFSRVAAWCLVALLIAVFPANIYMAMNWHDFPEFSRTSLFLRLPLQFVFIGCVFYYTKKH